MVVIVYLKESFRIAKDIEGKKWLVHESYENGNLDIAHRIVGEEDFWACPACQVVVPIDVGATAMSEKVEDPPRMLRYAYDVYRLTHDILDVDYSETD